MSSARRSASAGSAPTICSVERGMPDGTDFNPAQAIRVPPSGGRRPLRKRLLAGIAAVAAAALGAAPHVLHHAGPLAGAALLGGVAGSLLFGALGFALMVPWLLRLRRRSGGWRLPTATLGLFVAAFLVSTLLVGPALSDDDEAPSRGQHDQHHR